MKSKSPSPPPSSHKKSPSLSPSPKNSPSPSHSTKLSSRSPSPKPRSHSSSSTPSNSPSSKVIPQSPPLPTGLELDQFVNIKVESFLNDNLISGLSLSLPNPPDLTFVETPKYVQYDQLLSTHLRSFGSIYHFQMPVSKTIHQLNNLDTEELENKDNMLGDNVGAGSINYWLEISQTPIFIDVALLPINFLNSYHYPDFTSMQSVMLQNIKTGTPLLVIPYIHK